MSLKKETRATLWWLLFIVIAAVMTGLFLYPRYQLLRENQRKLRRQQEQLARKKGERVKLRDDVEALKTSPEAVERVAREKYQMAGADETILVYTAPRPGEEK
ncbi:MAG: septum formation initiator family protein [Lentisphaeria bacterium]|nr:septum formation initiator family protein [Lentisphaeria bacterium]